MRGVDPIVPSGTFLLIKREGRLFLLVTPASPVSLLDINECIMGGQNCRLGESCINTVGSFRCQRDSSCGTGYELTEGNDCKGRISSESQNPIPRKCV